MDFGSEIARAALRINAIMLRPGNPFEWDSGYRMPVYNDNRLFLFHPEYRELITNAFLSLIVSKTIAHDIIAGVATGGIAYGMILADRLKAPFVYIRETRKGHGRGRQIEGIHEDKALMGKQVLVIDDLISTGGSSIRAIEAVRKVGGTCENCLAIFSYGFAAALAAFRTKVPGCAMRSLLTFDVLLTVLRESGVYTGDEMELLERWSEDPFHWAEGHGFPEVEGR